MERAHNRTLDVLTVGLLEAAVAAARLGVSTALIKKIDPDIRDHLVELLQNEGVSKRFVVTRSASPHEISRTGLLTPMELIADRPAFEQAKVALIAIDSSVKIVTSAVELATLWGATTVFSPIAPLRVPDLVYKKSHALVMRSDLATAFTGIDVRDRTSAHKAADVLLSHGAHTVFIDAGSDGDLLIAPGHELWIPRFAQTKVIDKTCMAEAKAAAFAAYLAEGHDLAHCALFAAAAGNLTASRAGGLESLPLRDEVLELLNTGTRLPIDDVAA